MGCFFSKKKAKKDHVPVSSNIDKEKVNLSKDGGWSHTIPTIFTFQELALATNNFAADRLIGEGGFGKLYKGWLEKSKQIVAIKQFDQAGNRAFLVEVLMSSLLHHPNLVDMIGYCVEGDHRQLVFEYMPLGSLNDLLHEKKYWLRLIFLDTFSHIFKKHVKKYGIEGVLNKKSNSLFLHHLDRRPGQSPLDWKTRMKIAAGISRGLEYLHCKVDPPVIYRNWKSSNILLDKEYRPVLSGFRLAKLGPTDGEPFVSTRLLGTPGYVAPEYAMEGLASLAGDVYSFGVVLLVIITGRKAIDISRPPGEKNIVAWVLPLLQNRKKYATIVDPVLKGRYPTRELYHALDVAAMCVQEKPCTRPLMGDVRHALDYVVSHYEPEKEEIKA